MKQKQIERRRGGVRERESTRKREREMTENFGENKNISDVHWYSLLVSFYLYILTVLAFIVVLLMTFSSSCLKGFLEDTFNDDKQQKRNKTKGYTYIMVDLCLFFFYL